jgi:NADH-quinone oxidoreductase subunit M
MTLAQLTFLPLAGALLLLLVPGRSHALLRALALGATLATAVFGLRVYQAFDGASADVQFGLALRWFELPGGTQVWFRMGLDGLSILMVALTAILMPVVILSTWASVEHRLKEFLIWMLVMETGMLGVFLSLDVVLFYVFWEVSLIPLYFLVGIWGGERRLYATIKFFLFTVAGSLVMLVGVIALLYRFGTADVLGLWMHARRLSPQEQLPYFSAFALAFAIKVPVLPFHTWLADAHTEAPTAGSVVLAGVLLKMGTYGLLRFCIAMFPGAAVVAAPLFMALGALGIVYGAFLALAQTDLKRLVACSSVSHLGYVVLGLFALTPAGLEGGVLQMVNHGLSTGLLFLLVGMLYERRHTRALDQFGGLAAVMPVFAIFLVVTVLSSAGLPGLNGFVGEYLILLGAWQASPLWAAVGASGVIFGAVYLLMATRRVLWGPVTQQANRELSDLGAREVALMLPLVALVFWIGVAPNTFLDKGRGSLELVVNRVREAARVAALEQPGGARAGLALGTDAETTR